MLFIRKGKIRVDFYTDQRSYIESHILEAGNIILLSEGGHRFEIQKETDMIEIKQGPYAGEKDKTIFTPVDPAHVQF